MSAGEGRSWHAVRQGEPVESDPEPSRMPGTRGATAHPVINWRRRALQQLGPLMSGSLPSGINLRSGVQLVWDRCFRIALHTRIGPFSATDISSTPGITGAEWRRISEAFAPARPRPVAHAEVS
jgi:hypothetical protein